LIYLVLLYIILENTYKNSRFLYRKSILKSIILKFLSK